MTRNQYQYNWTTPKIKGQGCNSSYSRSIHQDDQVESNNYNSFIG